MTPLTVVNPCIRKTAIFTARSITPSTLFYTLTDSLPHPPKIVQIISVNTYKKYYIHIGRSIAWRFKNGRLILPDTY